MNITKCPLCRNDVTHGMTMFSADLGDGVLIVKNVPAIVCSVCGDKWFEHETMLKLEEIANNARSRHTIVEVITFDAA